MLLWNNNNLKKLSNRLMKSDKRRNRFVLIAVFLTTILLTTVSYVGLTMYGGFKNMNEAADRFTTDSTFLGIGVALLILLVIGSGYLIINNIFYISIVNDIRFYGQLKTLGCTKSQIGKLMYSLGLKISIKGIPIGVILGLIMGRIISNIALKETVIWNYVGLNNYVLPSVLGILFTLVTLFISIRKPVKSIGKISAVEAIKHNAIEGNWIKKIKKKTREGSRIKNMAKDNMIKNKKKVIASVLSIALSSTLLAIGLIIAFGLNVEEHGRRENIGDVNVDASHNRGEIISQDQLDKIKALEGVKNVEVTYSSFTNREMYLDPRIKIEIDDNSYNKEFANYKESYDYSYINKEPELMITAMNKDMLSRNLDRTTIYDGKSDLEKFEAGNYVIVNRNMNEVKDGLKAGDKITIKKDGVDLELKVMAVVGNKDSNYMSNTLGVLTISNKNLKKLANSKVMVSNIVIDTNKDLRKDVLDNVREIIGTNGSTKGIDEFIEGVRNLKNGILIGVSLGTLVFLAIAVMNMVNIAITDLIQRKKEFSSLEAIGMERKMLMDLIDYEGIYYLILSSILIIPLSIVAALIIPHMLPIYGGFSFGAVIIAVVIIFILIYLIMIVLKKNMLKSILNKEPLTGRLEEF